MNILDLLNSRGVKTRRVAGTKGGEWHSPCPVCGGRDRFQSWPNDGAEGGRWFCRGCGQGGDCIQFLRHVENLGFREACERLGLERSVSYRRLPDKHQHPAPEAFTGTPRDLPPELWREKAAKLWFTAHGDLLRRADAQAWLAKRGISQAGIVQARLGWLAGEKDQKCYYRSRSGWGLPKEEKHLNDGRVVEKKQWIPRGLLLPTFQGEEVVALRVRLPEADRREMNFSTPYYVVPGSAALPLVLVDERVAGPVRAWVIVESQLDAVAVAEACVGPDRFLPVGAAAMLSNTGKPDPALHQKLASAERILVALDYDQPGTRGWNWWKETYPNAERWPVPEGKDPGDYAKLGGSLFKWIEEGLRI